MNPDISKDERLEANRRSWMSLDIPSYRTDFRIHAKLTDTSIGISCINERDTQAGNFSFFGSRRRN